MLNLMLILLRACRLALAGPVPPRLGRVLDLTQARDLFPTADGIDAAGTCRPGWRGSRSAPATSPPQAGAEEPIKVTSPTDVFGVAPTRLDTTGAYGPQSSNVAATCDIRGPTTLWVLSWCSITWFFRRSRLLGEGRGHFLSPRQVLYADRLARQRERRRLFRVLATLQVSSCRGLPRVVSC